MNAVLETALNDGALELLKFRSKYATDRLAVGVDEIDDEQLVRLSHPFVETKGPASLVDQLNIRHGGLLARYLQAASLLGGERRETLCHRPCCPDSQQQEDRRGRGRSHPKAPGSAVMPGPGDSPQCPHDDHHRTEQDARREQGGHLAVPDPFR